MSACETCWAVASFRAHLGQGFTADLYREELDAHPEHEPVSPSSVSERNTTT